MLACPVCAAVYSDPVECCALDGSKLVESERAPMIGRTLERYEIVERLGAGAMGHIYRARHTELGIECAVKVLQGELAGNRLAAERFRREARAASRIRHPNIVAVTDFGQTENGLSFMVMELVPGRPLSHIMAEVGVVDIERSLTIIRQLTHALAAAHAVGFIHRDVKPSNVMVHSTDDDGDLVKLLDFGIALPVRDKLGRLTDRERRIGTPRYMAPEQIRGTKLTPAADLYGIGAIFWELLAGRPLYTGVALDIFAAKLNAPPSPLPHPSPYEDLIYDLLARRPEERPGTAADVLARLDDPSGADVASATGTADVPPAAELVYVQPAAPVDDTRRSRSNAMRLAAIGLFAIAATFVTAYAFIPTTTAPHVIVEPSLPVRLKVAEPLSTASTSAPRSRPATPSLLFPTSTRRLAPQRRTAGPKPKTVSPRPAPPNTIAPVLARAHLTTRELKLEPSTARAYENWQRSPNEESARTVEAVLDAGGLCRILDRELVRIHDALSRQRSSLDKSVFGALEDQLLELSISVDDGLPVEECRVLAPKVRGLGTAIGEARRP